ncbi:MAG: hypothetical protein ABWZ80_09570 [Beijerinckiaceae bacterium]
MRFACAAARICCGVLGGATFPALAESPEDIPDHPGREETFYYCIACHSFRVVGRQGMSRERWDQTLDWMTEKHSMPKLAGEERKVILDYLEQAYPPTAQRAPGGWVNPFAPK